MGERKPFATRIDETISKKFKKKCVNEEVNMNDVLEKFMLEFVEGKHSTLLEILKKK